MEDIELKDLEDVTEEQIEGTEKVHSHRMRKFLNIFRKIAVKTTCFSLKMLVNVLKSKGLNCISKKDVQNLEDAYNIGEDNEGSK